MCVELNRELDHQHERERREDRCFSHRHTEEREEKQKKQIESEQVTSLFLRKKLTEEKMFAATNVQQTAFVGKAVAMKSRTTVRFTTRRLF